MHKGFSFLELLVISSVLGAVSLVGVQSYASYHESQRLKLAAIQVYDALVSGRALSYSKRQDLWLVIDRTASNTFLILSRDSNAEEVLSRREMEHLELTTTSDQIHFDGYLGAVLGNGSVTLADSNGERLRVIYHQLSGRIRVCSPDRGSLGYAAC